MPHHTYASDLSDAEWRLLELLIPALLPGGRPAKWTWRELVDAMLYVLQTGCARSLLPHDFPPSLSQGDELLPITTETWIYLSMVRLMAHATPFSVKFVIIMKLSVDFLRKGS